MRQHLRRVLNSLVVISALLLLTLDLSGATLRFGQCSRKNDGNCLQEMGRDVSGIPSEGWLGELGMALLK